MNPFEFVNSITYKKDDLMPEDDLQAEANYSPFMVNRALGYFPDTVLYANIMNQYTGLPNKMQYDFLRQIVRKRRRFSKWAKRTTTSDFDIVKEYTGYNDQRTAEVIDLFSEEDIKAMKAKLYTGGTK